MSTAIGIHVEANSAGYSRDRAIQCARNYGGEFATVVNDPMLCMMFLDIGMTPIHRINRNGLLDDNAHQRGYSARDYVRTANAEVPDKRALISLNNEPGQQDLERLRDFMLAGIDEANQLGRTLACLNWSYGNPEPSAESILAPVYRAIAAGKHYYCVHEGTDAQHPNLASCYPDLIGRFLDVQRRYGFRVLVTEFAASKDAWNGWQTWDSNFAEVCRDTVREVYAPNSVHMTPFTAFKWKTGFDYVDSPALQASWKETNILYPVKEQPVTQHNWGTRIDGATARCTTNINIRTAPSANAEIAGLLKNGDVVSYWNNPLPGSPFRWYKLLHDGQERFVAEVSGLRFDPPAPSVERISYSPEQVRALYDHLAAMKAVLDQGAPSNSGNTF